MDLVADTGPLYAIFDAKDRHHERVRSVFESYRGSIVVPLPVVTEVDYFLSRYLGSQAALDFVESLSTGAFEVDHLEPGDLRRCHELMGRYDDLGLGFVDASVMVVAERRRTREILTVDERDFRAVGRHDHGTFVLYPLDL